MLTHVGIVGAGQMGSGIAQVAAERGYAVVLSDVDMAIVERALANLQRSWARAVERGKMTAEAAARATAGLRGVAGTEALGACDLVVEAIVESLPAKQALFASLDRLCPRHTILATNTSALPVTALAMATARPDRVCGVHFFNPVPVMKLVEVVRTVLTGEEVFAAAMEFARSLGKEPVAAVDRAGFIVNRLLVPYLLDAVRALEARVASIQDVDTAMRLGCGHPIGPLALVDLIGLDTIAYIADIFFEEFRESRYAAPPLLRAMVRAGMLGKKAGGGFYDYSGTEPRARQEVLASL
jgi:3-hydroxybutyryl-CoA dehydrogenase